MGCSRVIPPRESPPKLTDSDRLAHHTPPTHAPLCQANFLGMGTKLPIPLLHRDGAGKLHCALGGNAFRVQKSIPPTIDRGYGGRDSESARGTASFQKRLGPLIDSAEGGKKSPPQQELGKAQVMWCRAPEFGGKADSGHLQERGRARGWSRGAYPRLTRRLPRSRDSIIKGGVG